MLAKAGLGPDSSINLVRQDGIRIVRFPYDVRDVGMDISAMPTFRRAVQERNGRFTERSGRDGVHRLFTFTQVGDLPLILAIGLSTEEIEAGWRAKALMIGLTLLALFCCSPSGSPCSVPGSCDAARRSRPSLPASR